MLRADSQREVMRILVSRYGRNEDIVCREYAQAEKRGEVRRLRNTHGMSPEEYARVLWLDGYRKRWF
jgi:hypothetical protein